MINATYIIEFYIDKIAKFLILKITIKYKHY
jgi:hypothetical protein